MILILLIILIPSVYFAIRFFLLSNDIRKSTNDLKEISRHIEANRRLKTSSGDKDFEKFLVVINEYLEENQIEKIKYIRREKEIRKEIENISHDLRTPLTSILGYLEFLENEKVSNEEKERYLEIVKRRSDGLYKLVEVFYEVSRLESNEYKFNIKKVDINKLLREHILLFYNEFEKRNIDVDISLLDEEVFIEADENGIERVFTNLFQNIMKYAKSKCEIDLEEKDENIIITLANDIYNLEECDIEYLFDRFYMKDASRSSTSSGLGLTVAKLLIEQMDGEITAKINNSKLCFDIKFEVSK